MTQLSLHSPLGPLTLAEEDGHIVSLDWGSVPEEHQNDTALLREARDQLNAYFDGSLTRFSLPLKFSGTSHQQKVWQALQDIRYGETRTYAELAKAIGSSARAVGTACGNNPVPVIVPCHRILAAGGRIGGYSGWGGTDTKVKLLRLEKSLL